MAIVILQFFLGALCVYFVYKDRKSNYSGISESRIEFILVQVLFRSQPSWSNPNCVATGFDYRVDIAETLDFIGSFIDP